MTGKIKLPHASGNSMSIAAPATNPASDLELKLPATIGSANQLLKNSGTAGTLEFASNLTFDGTDLGINVTPARSPLHIHRDNADCYVHVTNSTTGTGSGDGFTIQQSGLETLLNNREAGPMMLYTSGAERMRIDSSGNVTKPYNPVFRVNGAHSWVSLSNNASLILPFNNELLDVGSNYDTSNYRFTAPVAGKYYISVSLYWKAGTAATSNYITLEFQKNGSADSSGIDYGIYGTANDTTGSQYLTTDSIQNLSASDYVDIKIFARGGSISYYMGHSQFNGFLIG